MKMDRRRFLGMLGLGAGAAAVAVIPTGKALARAKGAPAPEAVYGRSPIDKVLADQQELNSLAKGVVNQYAGFTHIRLGSGPDRGMLPHLRAPWTARWTRRVDRQFFARDDVWMLLVTIEFGGEVWDLGELMDGSHAREVGIAISYVEAALEKAVRNHTDVNWLWYDEIAPPQLRALVRRDQESRISQPRHTRRTAELRKR